MNVAQLRKCDVSVGCTAVSTFPAYILHYYIALVVLYTVLQYTPLMGARIMCVMCDTRPMRDTA